MFLQFAGQHLLRLACWLGENPPAHLTAWHFSRRRKLTESVARERQVYDVEDRKDQK
jgi:hypothetical protein